MKTAALRRFKVRNFKACAIILAVAWPLHLVAPIARAELIQAGDTYLLTNGPDVVISGTLQLDNDPIGFSPDTNQPYDTVIRRLAPAIVFPPSPSSSDTIPIEIVALSLRSIAPIHISGFDFNLTVDIVGASLGTMTIRHEFAEGTGPTGATALGTLHQAGTYDLAATLLLRATYTLVGGGLSNSSNFLADYQIANGPWYHNPNDSADMVLGRFVTASLLTSVIGNHTLSQETVARLPFPNRPASHSRLWGWQPVWPLDAVGVCSRLRSREERGWPPAWGGTASALCPRFARG